MNIIKQFQEAKNPWQLVPQLSEKELVDAITVASDSYYNTGIALISDEVFDAMKERLEHLNPKAKILQNIGAPIRGKKVELPYWMGSMDKIKSDEKVLSRWLKTYKGPYCISDKLDGISCLLVQADGAISLFTRGDGEYGQNVTHLLDLINIPQKALDSIADLEIAVRGELIISIAAFELYSNIMANARNMVGGLVNSKPKSVNKEHASHIDFVTYEIITTNTKASDQLKQLKKFGFDVVYYDVYKSINFDILDTVLQRRKRRSPYEIDGIIVTDDHKYKRNAEGNPQYSFAYKGISQTADVKVTDVLWKPSKDGMLIPRVQVEKTRLSGVDIEFATGFNAKFVTDNKLGPGAVVTLVRSGDTIPHILAVVKAAKKTALPVQYEYKWDKNEVHFVLKHAAKNKTVIIQRLTKFVRQIGVENMSEGLVTKLVNAGFDSIPKLMQLKVSDLLEIEGFKATLANKIYDGLRQAFDNLDMLTLMAASNVFGRGFGKRRIRAILDYYPDIADTYKSKDRTKWYGLLIALDGFDQITVDGFLDGLEDFQAFLKAVRRLITIQPYGRKVKANGLFEGQVVVFTGFREPAWNAFVEAEGGTLGSGVTRNSTLLVYKDGEESTAKYQNALKWGIKSMPRSVFSQTYGLPITH